MKVHFFLAKLTVKGFTLLLRRQENRLCEVRREEGPPGLAHLVW